MSDSIPWFLKKEGDSLLFNNDEGYFAFYVPEHYFRGANPIALIVGEYINIIGILDYTVFKEDGTNIGLKPFRFPTVFLTQPREIDKLRNVKLTKNSEEQDYRVFKYYKGDSIVVSTKVPKDAANIGEYYKLFLSGHLPTTIKYDEMYEYFLDNITLNGGSYSRVGTQLLGVVTSEMCRDAEDRSIPYRLSKDKSHGYYAANIREIPKLVSPFTAITSENWDEGVISAIEMNNDMESPMEAILTG